jgi:hypothetical protein
MPAMTVFCFLKKRLPRLPYGKLGMKRRKPLFFLAVPISFEMDD